MTVSKPIDLDSEREFHNKRFEDGDSRQAQLKYYWSIQKGAEKYWDYVKSYSKDAAVLSYGCGLGEGLSNIVQQVKSLDGIDISDVAIGHAQSQYGSPSSRFQVMDAMNLTFPDQSFDLVFGSGIIHHLDLERCTSEICRVLKPGGKAIFWEPMGTNPIINAYRYLTPSARTPDEHPLLPRDFAKMRAIASKVDVEYFGFATLFAMPFHHKPLGEKILSGLENLDKLLLRVKGLRSMAWYSLITLTK
jgi:SAM-dependent methyltransferase